METDRSGGSFARERPRGGLVMVHALPTVQAQAVLPVVAVAAEESSVNPVVPSSSTSGTSSATAKGVIVGTDYR